jgi:hypothetical protein
MEAEVGEDGEVHNMESTASTIIVEQDIGFAGGGMGDSEESW